MPDKELFERYVEEFCSKCTNKCKEVNLCNITIREDNKERVAKCVSYNNEVQA